MGVPNHEDTVADVRQKFPPTLTNNECVALCNEVAWIHRAEGFGIAEKTSGSLGVRYDGQKASIDGLVYTYRDGSHVDQFIDILKNADGDTPPAAEPQWSVSETSNRKWVAPIAPKPGPGPGPGPSPGPEAEYVTHEEFTAYQQRVDQQLADLQADVAQLRTDLDHHVTGLQDQITELDARWGRARVRGRTEENKLHSHEMDLPIEVLPPQNT